MKKQVFIFIFVILFAGACEKKKCNDLANIEEYVLQEQYEDVVKDYSGCRWDEMDDPWELMAYIDACERLDRKLPRSLKNESEKVGNLSKGYYLLLKGHMADSFNYLMEVQGPLEDKVSQKLKEGQILSEDQLMEFQKLLESNVWFLVGLLEHAQYADDLSRYNGYLDDLKWLSDSYMVRVPKRLIPYYQGYYYIKTGAFDKLDSLLAEHADNLHPYDRMEFLFEMYVYKNKLELAGEIIEQQISDYPLNQHAHELKALLLYYQHGEKEAIAYLDGILKKFPDMDILKISYADYLLFSGHLDEGMEVLETLCSEGVCEGMNGIYIADMMITYGQPEGAEIFKKFFPDLNYAKLPYLQHMIAELEYARDNVSSMRKILRYARTANPYADYILWFEYRVAEEKNNYYAAEEKLMQLYKLSPNDVDVLFELAKIHYAQDKYEMAEKYETKLRDSIRYVPEAYIKELSAMKEPKGSSKK